MAALESWFWLEESPGLNKSEQQTKSDGSRQLLPLTRYDIRLCLIGSHCASTRRKKIASILWGFRASLPSLLCMEDFFLRSRYTVPRPYPEATVMVIQSKTLMSFCAFRVKIPSSTYDKTRRSSTSTFRFAFSISSDSTPINVGSLEWLVC